jgi:hypothetical protein
MRQRQPRQIDADHLAFVRSLPCCVCGNDIETEAAHVRLAAARAAKREVGKGEKPDDIWTVPLCGKHHREQHTMSEDMFWRKYSIDPLAVAAFLALRSGDTEAGEQIVRNTP